MTGGHDNEKGQQFEMQNEGKAPKKEQPPQGREGRLNHAALEEDRPREGQVVGQWSQQMGSRSTRRKKQADRMTARDDCLGKIPAEATDGDRGTLRLDGHSYSDTSRRRSRSPAKESRTSGSNNSTSRRSRDVPPYNSLEERDSNCLQDKGQGMTESTSSEEPVHGHSFRRALATARARGEGV